MSSLRLAFVNDAQFVEELRRGFNIHTGAHEHTFQFAYCDYKDGKVFFNPSYVASYNNGNLDVYQGHLIRKYAQLFIAELVNRELITINLIDANENIIIAPNWKEEAMDELLRYVFIFAAFFGTVTLNPNVETFDIVVEPTALQTNTIFGVTNKKLMDFIKLLKLVCPHIDGGGYIHADTLNAVKKFNPGFDLLVNHLRLSEVVKGEMIRLTLPSKSGVSHDLELITRSEMKDTFLYIVRTVGTIAHLHSKGQSVTVTLCIDDSENARAFIDLVSNTNCIFFRCNGVRRVSDPIFHYECDVEIDLL